ncbi:hypothetical protein AVL61_01725 [Kocuria rosea subsp. polaris]|uniref:Lipoprotein n=1 Tax=Kocuria rosea subsp. polaris TaxID=136273 RepID=A0A0W8INX2_KOCRO|nr:hypothetical protein [Kocuria polaris]KUG61652.1 hypothetical protein AVL61_01725 [Kocuria polaris]
MTRRTLTLAAAGLAGSLLLTACQDETQLTQLDQSGVPTEELVGEEITLTNEVEEIFGEEFLTMGDEQTIVFVTEMPADLRPGDSVEATGTVEAGDVFSEPEDRDRLMLMTDEGTANYLVNRDSEPYLTEATVTVVE